MRIEVKSTLTRDDIRSFVVASLEVCDFAALRAPEWQEFVDEPINLLFAYRSDAEGKGDADFQLKRVTEVMREQGCDPLSGKVSMVLHSSPYGSGNWECQVENVVGRDSCRIPG